MALRMTRGARWTRGVLTEVKAKFRPSVTSADLREAGLLLQELAEPASTVS